MSPLFRPETTFEKGLPGSRSWATTLMASKDALCAVGSLYSATPRHLASALQGAPWDTGVLIDGAGHLEREGLGSHNSQEVFSPWISIEEADRLGFKP